MEEWSQYLHFDNGKTPIALETTVRVI